MKGGTIVQIQAARIQWCFGYGNSPDLQILVDKVPETATLLHDVKVLPPARDGNYTLYFAEKDGYVHFMAHNAKNETGYGGSIIPVRIKPDGAIKLVKGPWSGNSASMTEHGGFMPSMAVDIADHICKHDKCWHPIISGHITLTLAQEALREHVNKLPHHHDVILMTCNGDIRIRLDGYDEDDSKIIMRRRLNLPKDYVEKLGCMIPATHL